MRAWVAKSPTKKNDKTSGGGFFFTRKSNIYIYKLPVTGDLSPFVRTSLLLTSLLNTEEVKRHALRTAATATCSSARYACDMRGDWWWRQWRRTWNRFIYNKFPRIQTTTQCSRAHPTLEILRAWEPEARRASRLSKIRGCLMVCVGCG